MPTIKQVHSKRSERTCVHILESHAWADVVIIAVVCFMLTHIEKEDIALGWPFTIQSHVTKVSKFPTSFGCTPVKYRMTKDKVQVIPQLVSLICSQVVQSNDANGELDS